MMKMTVVGTGSSGNAYILENNGYKLFLDAGMPMKEIIKASGGLKGVEGCVVTHEHQDHAKAVDDMRHYGVHVFASHGTGSMLKLWRDDPFFNVIEMYKQIKTEHFIIIPFPTEHDAAEPCGFLIQCKPTGENILYATDTYYLRNTFPNIHFWIVECNYTEDLLKEQEEQGLIEKQLVNRLRKSHMSLARLKKTLMANDLTRTVKIILVHLSDGRSNEEQMVNEITELTGKETIAADAGMVIDLNLTPF